MTSGAQDHILRLLTKDGKLDYSTFGRFGIAPSAKIVVEFGVIRTCILAGQVLAVRATAR
jgi:hypothetical protein